MAKSNKASDNKASDTMATSNKAWHNIIRNKCKNRTSAQPSAAPNDAASTGVNNPNTETIRTIRPLLSNAPTPPNPKRFSLSWRMVQMLLLCWVLPVMLVVLCWGVYLRQTLIDQSYERHALNMQGANQLTTMRLDAAVQASRTVSYIGGVRTAWSTYQTDNDKVALFDTTRTFLQQQYQSDEKFYSTILLFSDFVDEPIYVVNGAVGGTDQVRQDATEIFATAQEIGETLDTAIGFFAVGHRTFMVRNLVNSKYQPIALLMMELNTDLIFQEFSQLPNLEIATATIDGVGVEITPKDPYEGLNFWHTQEDLPTHRAGTDGIVVTYRENAMFNSAVATQKDYDFAFYGITSPVVLHQQWNMTIAMLTVVVLLMLPMGALLFQFFTRYVTHPLQVILRSTDEIRHGKYGIQLPQTMLRSQEIGALGDNFNQMSATLQEQFEHIYKEEIALRDARIMALQSQINPHFLNNTLEIINWEARMQGNLKVCNMIESLSTMLGAAMDRNSRRSVHLSEELMYVDAYLYIINERLGKRLTFEKQIPDEFLDVRVPRLILQPILENAVEHGITPVQQGRIVLSAARQGDWLILSVENDGEMTEQGKRLVSHLLGDPDEATREAISSNSLGLRNVHQRLRILYGEEAGILVDTTKKGVTIFQLKVKFC